MNRRFALKSAAAAGLFALVAGCTTSGGNDIVDIASSNDDFSTLVAAVSAAGLVDTLKGDGPFTVFAPTNAAFAKLPAGTVESPPKKWEGKIRVPFAIEAPLSGVERRFGPAGDATGEAQFSFGGAEHLE